MQKKLLIIALTLLSLMVISYATFSSKLNISGTSSITSNWNIEITNIEKKNYSGNIVEKETSYTSNTANFKIQMEKPGDYIYYKIEVTNKGNISAIAKLGTLTCTNDVFECKVYPDSSLPTSITENTDLTNSRLIIAPNEKEYYNIYIKFKDSVTIMPQNKENIITLNLIYSQSDVGITHKNDCYTGKVLKNGTLSITSYNETCGTDVVIPETIDGYTVTEIADGSLNPYVGVFSNKKLTSVTVPDTITYIGNCAFANNKITTLNLSKNLKEIGESAFIYNQITSFIAPNTLTKIGHYVFRGNKISEIKLNEGLEYIGCASFMGNLITEIEIPSTVTNIQNGAFTQNKVDYENAFIYNRNSDGTINYSSLNSYAGESMTGKTIPENITDIGPEAFESVRWEEITIPSRIKIIKAYVFCGCRAKKITIEEGVEEIGHFALEMNNITEIEIPVSVKKITYNAFANNKNLVTINVKNKANSIENAPWGSNATVNWLIK